MMFNPLAARILAALVLAIGFASTTTAQDAPAPTAKPVTVGVYVNPPFIIKDGASYSGLAFELFEDVARRGNLAPTYVDYTTPKDLLAATTTGDIDVGIGNLTVTRERSQAVDFTFPWHDGGLRIMTDGKAAGLNVREILGELGDAGHLRAFLWLGFFIIAATILLTIFDRKFDKDFPKRWVPGFIESFYHVMSITTSGKTSRKNLFGHLGRLFSAFWLLFGVAVLAYVTSSVTSVMTAAAVTDEINDVGDLRDRTVGVLAGGASELYARSIGLTVRPYDSIVAADVGLRAAEIDAIVGDSMALEYHAHHIADAGLQVVGPLFDPEKYGFVTPPGSPLAHAISLDLLGAHEDGTTETLRAKYLGVDH
jgi:ABC-type amino acid transport substrate-binding protein